jgi:hypothetical protein
MAKIQEQIIVIKVSKLVKDSAHTNSPIISDDFMNNIEAVVQELAGDDVVIEVITDNGN